jgi:NAD(P)-dependent dehydrogenase (short-subunit alcohol dehydrogenase family)
VSTDDTIDLGQARKLMDGAAERLGKIDIVVNNAGIILDKTFHNLDDELWDFVLDVNLKTAFHTTLAAMPHLWEVPSGSRSTRASPPTIGRSTSPRRWRPWWGTAGRPTTPRPRAGSPR